MFESFWIFGEYKIAHLIIFVGANEMINPAVVKHQISAFKRGRLVVE
jgi:hypothetical protein